MRLEGAHVVDLGIGEIRAQRGIGISDPHRWVEADPQLTIEPVTRVDDGFQADSAFGERRGSAVRGKPVRNHSNPTNVAVFQIFLELGQRAKYLAAVVLLRVEKEEDRHPLGIEQRPFDPVQSRQGGIGES